LASQWIPKIKDSDLIFVHRHWAITPIFYYLKENRYQFVGGNYSDEVQRHPGSRVWALALYGMPMKQEIKSALKDYQIEGRLHAYNIGALLFVKN
jgi:hypothetical protein